MTQVTLAVEEHEHPEALVGFLMEIASLLKEEGCEIATPAPGSWLVAACGDALLAVYPMPPAVEGRVAIDTSAALILRIEGAPESIVKLVKIVLGAARSRGIRVKPVMI